MTARLLLFLFLFGAGLRAAEPLHVSLQAQSWAVPAELAAPLLPRLRDPAFVPEAIETLRRYAAEGRATLAAQARMLCTPHEKPRIPEDPTIGGGQKAFTLAENETFAGAALLVPYPVPPRFTSDLESPLLRPEILNSAYETLYLTGAVLSANKPGLIQIEAATHQEIIEGWGRQGTGVTYGGVQISWPVPRVRICETRNRFLARSGQWTVFATFPGTRPGAPAIIHLLRATNQFAPAEKP